MKNHTTRHIVLIAALGLVVAVVAVAISRGRHPHTLVSAALPTTTLAPLVIPWAGLNAASYATVAPSTPVAPVYITVAPAKPVAPVKPVGPVAPTRDTTFNDYVRP